MPTCTSRSPGASGSAPVPRSRSTSQRAGVHVARQPTARQVDVRGEPLDACERDEVAGHGALAEEDDRGRAGEPESGELRAGGLVEPRIGLVGADGNAEPDGAHRPGGGRDSLDCLRDAPVLRDLGAGKDADQDGRPDRDPDGCEKRPR